MTTCGCRCTLRSLLANLLPGLRDFRTPFASGVLWLAFIWLLISPENVSDFAVISDKLVELGEVLKPLGLGAALSLCAYLVGSLWEILWSSPWKRLPQLSPRGLRALQTLVPARRPVGSAGGDRVSVVSLPDSSHPYGELSP